MIVTAGLSSEQRSAALIIYAGVIVAALLFTACNQKSAVKDFDHAKDASLNSEVKRGIKPQADDQVAVIASADFGDIVIELYPNVAPEMVERFKKLIQEGFYDGTTFHRINAASGLIQGGDPLSRDADPSNDGAGDSPYPNVPGEFSDIPFERGIVGAARQGAHPAFAGHPAMSEEQARKTGNCQFFIVLSRAPQLDEDYTVFGRVIQGIGNAEIIMRAPADENTERPAERIVIKSITLQPRSKYIAEQD